MSFLPRGNSQESCFQTSPVTAAEQKENQTVSLMPNYINKMQRRSSDFLVKAGKPFIKLQPNSDSKKTKQSFFLDHDENKISDHNTDFFSLDKAIKAMTPQQCFKACCSVGINPPNQATLLRIVEMYFRDEQILTRIKDAISRSYIDTSLQKGSHTCIYDNDFMDIRYRIPSHHVNFNIDPIEAGRSLVDFSFQLPKLPPKIHVVLQSLLVGQNGHVPCWPNTLRIMINGKQAKNIGRYPFPLFDLSAFGTNVTIRIICNTEPGNFLLQIRCGEYFNMSEIVTEIQRARFANEIIDPNSVSLIAPFTGQVLRNPVRGINCTHQQCFELKPFLKIANTTRKWVCPLCNKPLPFKDIIYSHQTVNLLKQVFSTSPVTIDAVTRLDTTLDVVSSIDHDVFADEWCSF